MMSHNRLFQIILTIIHTEKRLLYWNPVPFTFPRLHMHMDGLLE